MCKHEHLQAISTKVLGKRKELLFCMDCGAELPIDFLTAGNAQKQAGKAVGDTGTGKPTRKKRTAQKAE